MTHAEIWRALEREPAAGGAFRRRIHPEALVDLFLVVHKPTNQRALLIDHDLSQSGIEDLPEGRGVALRWQTSTTGGTALELFLCHPAFSDLFDTLVDDIAKDAARATDKNEIGPRVASRLARWQSFLEETARGLSRDRQRGLYGELRFLRDHLVPAIGAEDAIRAWLGPSGTPQDFSLGSIAVEVKTTATKQHQVLRITSERQLDTTALQCLVLSHLSLDAREGTGESLPDLVSSVRAQVSAAPAAASLFEDRLLEAGYADAHRETYRDGYVTRDSHVFLVTADFPRISERMCPSGVGDVSYSISLSALMPFAINEPKLYELLHQYRGL